MCILGRDLLKLFRLWRKSKSTNDVHYLFYKYLLLIASMCSNAITLNVSDSRLVICLKRTPTYIWVVGGLVWIQEQAPKRHPVFQRDWTTCSKLVNYSRFNSQHNLEGRAYNHLRRKRIFTLALNHCSYKLQKWWGKEDLTSIWKFFLRITS